MWVNVLGEEQEKAQQKAAFQAYCQL